MEFSDNYNMNKALIDKNGAIPIHTIELEFIEEANRREINVSLTLKSINKSI